MPHTRPSTRPSTRPLLAIILVSYFMIILDNSIIFTGLPRLQAELGLGTTELSWVQNAYTLVFGGLLLLGARAGDLLGRRRVFVAGLAVFGLASFLIGAAPDAAWLVSARALQGVGAAVVAPTALSLLTAHFAPGPERTRAVAAYGAVAGIGASVGLLVGGAAAEWISWRAGFFLNVPLGALLAVAALRTIPASPRARGRFDLAGALCSTLGVGGIILGVVTVGERAAGGQSAARDAGWAAPGVVVPLAVGAALLVLLVVNEARAAQPIMPLRLFASRERAGAYAARMLFAGTMIAFFFFTTQFLQGVYGFTPLEAGLGFFPMTVVNFAVAVYVPRLTRRFGNATLLAVGLAFTLAGIAWLAQITAATPYWDGVALPMVLIGIGQGLAFGPLTAAGIAGLGAAEAGAGSGLVNTAHQLGSTLGVAVLVAVSAGASASSATPGSAPPGAAALAREVAAAYAGGTVMLTAALAVVLALIVPAERAARRATTLRKEVHA